MAFMELNPRSRSQRLRDPSELTGRQWFSLIEESTGFAISLILAGQAIHLHHLPAEFGIASESFDQINMASCFSVAADGTVTIRYLDYQAASHPLATVNFYEQLLTFEKYTQKRVNPADVIVELRLERAVTGLASIPASHAIMKYRLQSFLDLLNMAEIIELGCTDRLRPADRGEIFPYLRWRWYGFRTDGSLDQNY